MAIPYDMRLVLDRFLSRITAYDNTDTFVKHQSLSTKGSDYWFAGVIYPVSETDLLYLDEGEIKNDAYIIYTRNKQLFFKDIQAPNASAKQTFIYHLDRIYKIGKEIDRTADGLYKKYICSRYVERAVSE